MQEITIWHNPKCSKSREAMSILEQNSCEVEVVKYLDVAPSKDEIITALTMLGMNPKELMRTKEDIYKELNLKEEYDYDKLVDAMVANPKLIERPIIFKGNRAIIGRPTEIIEAFLKS
ncbi:MAG: arsenate reductase (glutaredoxin) [Sulfurimonas sp.]|jgi:arsenate reductase|uniref:arsenate reductase (glutaredoxin) n=1 Tax=Sulfurimonas sp. TaxID=2022749 RepID=UPI00260E6EDD|nr:arsenate reductase (glutaredoxin) [Sulfurimonas sp.]MDD3475277.1 arsenate reductase (glutaredoxin) [Sulfurimonas sp.]